MFDKLPDDDVAYETLITELIQRGNALPEGSAEQRMIARQLAGIQKTELGALIIDGFNCSAKLRFSIP
jgi:hypothetical protein